MTIATRINDIIALSASRSDAQLSEVLTERELCLIFGGSRIGDSTWQSSDAAFEQQQAAQARFDSALQSGLEALGNLDMGSATRHANEAFNAYGDLSTATENLHQAVDSDARGWEAQSHVDTQIANGHNYSPTDANMTNYDGSPGVGDSY